MSSALEIISSESDKKKKNRLMREIYRMKPRGRMARRRALQNITGYSRNGADMSVAIQKGLCDELKETKLKVATVPGKKRGETTATVLAYVAQFPEKDQPKMYRLLNRLGSRGAKRFVECLRKPPTADDIARRLLRWLEIEFPEGAVKQGVVARACKIAGNSLMSWRAINKIRRERQNTKQGNPA